MDGTTKSVSYYDSIGQGGCGQRRRRNPPSTTSTTWAGISDLGQSHGHPRDQALQEKVYDSSRVWQEKDAEEHITTYVYDPGGTALCRVTFPDATYVTTSYNDYLRQKVTTDTNGQQRLTTTDPMGNVREQSLVYGLDGDSASRPEGHTFQRHQSDEPRHDAPGNHDLLRLGGGIAGSIGSARITFPLAGPERSKRIIRGSILFRPSATTA